MASPSTPPPLAVDDHLQIPTDISEKGSSRPQSREGEGPFVEPDGHDHRKGPEEGDTCRICRSEGTDNEPLFYPCKCSGSIRFVHQECLMEWLSHSQKKYCELCKTPFRFTKLYHPEMPSRLPTAVFLRRAVFHLLSHALIWCRALLVAFVWIVCLPWCMRSAWSMMFWFGDAGWARDLLHNETSITQWLEEHPGIQRIAMAEANLTNVLGAGESAYMASSKGPYSWRFFTALGMGVLSALHLERAAPVNIDNSTEHDITPLGFVQRSSLLSDLPILKGLTSHTYLNRLIIDVLEGQLITLAVVIAFVLIFLIREWVVQQQPVIDLAVAEEDDTALAEAGGNAHQEHLEHENPERERLPERWRWEDTIESRAEQSEESPHKQNGDFSAEQDHPPNGVVDPSSKATTSPDDQESSDSSDSDGESVLNLVPASSPRPEMPSRERSFIATEIRRDLEEQKLKDDAPSTNVLKASTPRSPRFTEHLDEDGSQGSSSSSSWQHVNQIVDDGTGKHTLGINEILNEVENTDGRDSEPSSPDDDEDDFGHRDDRLGIRGAARRHNHAENNPFHPDYLGPPFDQPAEPLVRPESRRADPAPRDHSMFDRICDYFWGDIGVDRATDVTESSESSDVDDAHVVQNIADEAPFVPVVEGQRMLQPDDPFDDAHAVHDEREVRDPEVAAAAAEAGVDINEEEGGDPEDAEDLEGILELIGMQGPLVGLFQNALFSAILIGATVVAAVFLPYLWGKLTLLALARPMLILQIPISLVSAVVDFVLDIGLAVGWTVMVVLTGIYDSLGLVFNLPFKERIGQLFSLSWRTSESAWPRALNSGFLNTPRSEDLLFFSIESHAALQWLEGRAALCIEELSNTVLYLVDYCSTESSISTTVDMLKLAAIHQDLASLVAKIEDIGTQFGSYLLHGASIQIYQETDNGGVTFSPVLPHWTATDRILATLTGYALLLAGSIVYYSYLAPIFAHHRRLRRIEAHFIDFLNQAGGVAKVIFIISIEMIAFPLFCGVLLTIALAPLFPHSPGSSSLPFPQWISLGAQGSGSAGFYTDRPLTTLFLSWFLGTAYMFHFALFVSLCRRIMRPGVLYFIRDPDDPSFHPVRDVLERSVWGQLRKIGFSACVYGALILGALGGVVWGVAYMGHDILPIRWQSWGKGGSLEFPMDILFYNFLTPVVVRLARPSDGLQRMYKWWFRQCAKSLRLSSFLFGVHPNEEEGRHVRKTWKAWLRRDVCDAKSYKGSKENSEVYFVPDGKFVRVPASDAVRIPKGQPVFVEVDRNNKRLDGKSEDGIYRAKSPMVKMVYIPPWFKLRITAFVLLVWLFAAVTGVGITIVPLLCGRAMITGVFGGSEDTNDIYAFTLGIYTLGGLLYLSLCAPRLLRSIRARIPRPTAVGVRAVGSSLLTVAKFVTRATLTVYVFASFSILIPLLLSFLLELYFLMPLHTYCGSTPTKPTDSSQPSATHTINLIQTWTLGLLYTRLLMRYFLHHRHATPMADPAGNDNGPAADAEDDNRPGLVRRHDVDRHAAPGRIRRRNRLGEAARRVFRTDGATLLKPNARLATRYFIVPAILLFLILACVPPITARSILWGLRSFGLTTYASEAECVAATISAARASYPQALGLLNMLWMVGRVRRGFGKWAAVVRDEVYLVGERLHNYGEGRRRREGVRRGKMPVYVSTEGNGEDRA